eukprot:1262418-Prymnesium_polylepis.2
MAEASIVKSGWVKKLLGYALQPPFSERTTSGPTPVRVAKASERVYTPRSARVAPSLHSGNARAPEAPGLHTLH